MVPFSGQSMPFLDEWDDNTLGCKAFLFLISGKPFVDLVQRYTESFQVKSNDKIDNTTDDSDDMFPNNISQYPSVIRPKAGFTRRDFDHFDECRVHPLAKCVNDVLKKFKVVEKTGTKLLSQKGWYGSKKIQRDCLLRLVYIYCRLPIVALNWLKRLYKLELAKECHLVVRDDWYYSDNDYNDDHRGRGR